MDGLLVKQAEIHTSIQILVNNFKKENALRRKAIAERRLKELNELISEFTENHLILNQYDDHSNIYFTDNYYENTKQFYKEACDYIKQYVESGQTEGARKTQEQIADKQKGAGDDILKVTAPKGIRGSVDINKKMEEKSKKQLANYKAFERTIKNINIDGITERWEHEDTLKTLESRWKAIDSLHWELESELEDLEREESEELYNRCETKYNNIKKAINSRMWSEKHREKTTPNLEVPTFGGNYNQWVSFKDLFSEAIHKNMSLSGAQKMQFLKSKVRCEAEKLIQHLPISSENYTVCWDILNRRYNNKRRIFSAHINTFLELPTMKQQTLQQIKRMHDVTQESLNAIKNLGVDISTWDPLLIHILDQKLDSDSHLEYIESLKDCRELPALKDFLEFLEMKFTALETSHRRNEIVNIPPKSHPHFGQQRFEKPSTSRKFSNENNNNWNKGISGSYKPVSTSTFNVTTVKCPLCHFEHGLYNCRKFLELSDELRLKAVKDLRVCINCLFTHHGNECKSKQTCRKCNKKHNTLIHDVFSKPSNSLSGVTISTQNEIQQRAHSMQERGESEPTEVLLSTAMIRVKSSNGSFHNIRALIDAGSQVSLISERAAQLLKIKRDSCKGVIFGLGEKQNNGKGKINIECHSINTDYSFHTDVIIMSNLVGNLPINTFGKPQWKFIENITLADPDFYTSRPVDLLFGADIYSVIVQGGIIKGDDTRQPVAQQTKLGWLLCGGTKTYKCNLVMHNIEEIKKFWEVEEIGEQTQNQLSLEDQQCITFYNETTNRKEDGSYEVRLPLKENIDNRLGSSKKRALAQLRSLEKRFEKQPKLQQDYKAFMTEYKPMGHMKPSASRSNDPPEYYLPHHGVERADSLTTQYRVVFNASENTDTGCSLNQLMYTGPNLQTDLQMILLRWRQYQYVFTADIEKMFRMIWINETDQKYQKILWRDEPEQPIQTYNLTTVTYGTRAAPFLAMMTLRRLAADERENFPEASKVIENAFYMDDLVHGTDTMEGGMKLISDLNSLMQTGGFNLRKWSANEQKMLQDIKTQKITSKEDVFNFKTDNISKTLGLCWNATDDIFAFQCKMTKETTKTLTKRLLLSEISKLFDPLGWLAPLSAKLKILFQKLWKDELKWDDKVSSDIQKEWTKIKTELHVINEYEIPRWILCRKGDVIELHGFSDASMDIYACVIYARVRGQSKVVLVAAKTKLVPHKKAISLPRLELCGAYLLSKLMNKITDALSQHKLEIYGWTDSMVTLSWLQGEPRRWKPFVANRVKKTTDVMPSACWHYVKSVENPADAASRGLYAQQLRENKLWWHGPSWLLTFEREKQKHKHETYTTSEEARKKQFQVNFIQTEENIVDSLLNKYSSFTKVTRVVAWILRVFASNRQQLPSALTLHELSAAKTLIVKNVQEKVFGAELKHLRKGETVGTKSNILNLHPFIDKSGVLRVSGRLKNSTLNMEMKHPKIIPRDSRLAELLVNEAHKLTFHGGPRLTLANLRKQYWIPGGNNAVKKQLRKCVTCRKNNPTKHYQLMGDLPAARTEPAPPFYHTGVDYTGFVDIKENKKKQARTMKGYIALFICMVTKAIHLELVTDLTSSAFLAALRRMSARRGAPRHMYSDCGTNFVGANRILKEEYEILHQTFDENFGGVLANMEIEWHFNVPHWPSAVGIWERSVQSVKYHLRRVVGEQRLTFEEFSTILAQVEACLNSRPLCALTEDIEDLDYLTPAHFLTGRAGVTVIQTSEDARTRWHLTNQIFQQIWKRWREEYLALLNARNKWLQPQRNIQIQIQLGRRP